LLQEVKEGFGRNAAIDVWLAKRSEADDHRCRSFSVLADTWRNG
jgi:hypothetical protein